jgi:hypothetical protein
MERALSRKLLLTLKLDRDTEAAWVIEKRRLLEDEEDSSSLELLEDLLSRRGGLVGSAESPSDDFRAFLAARSWRRRSLSSS